MISFNRSKNNIKSLSFFGRGVAFDWLILCLLSIVGLLFVVVTAYYYQSSVFNRIPESGAVIIREKISPKEDAEETLRYYKEKEDRYLDLIGK